MPERDETPTVEQYATHYTDKLRFSDTDRLGHINNTVFAKLLESGRVDMVHHGARNVTPVGAVFVVARLAIDFLAEMNWPGEAVIGTRVGRLGRSSLGLEQAIFVAGQCVAKSDSVLVLMDETTRRSTELPEELRAHLEAFKVSKS